MWDVGWPFYGLDQVEVAADGDFDSYFNELLSAAGMDLLRLPVWNTASGQTDGLFGDDRAIVHDPAAMLLYPAAAADGQERFQESLPFQSVVSRLSDGLPDIQSRAGVSGGMPGVLFPMLALREDAQEQDVLWAVDALSGLYGLSRAREALRWVCDGARSPMETVLTGELFLPGRLRGSPSRVRSSTTWFRWMMPRRR